MSDILLPKGEEKDKELEYEATEKDEECFFLMYHFNWSPSEVNSLDDDYRKWIIARTFAQKNMEREAMQQMRIAQQIGPDLKVT